MRHLSILARTPLLGARRLLAASPQRAAPRGAARPGRADSGTGRTGGRRPGTSPHGRAPPASGPAFNARPSAERRPRHTTWRPPPRPGHVTRGSAAMATAGLPRAAPLQKVRG